jgi:hypothetical protein
MREKLKNYKKFIDGIVSIRESVLAVRFKKGVWHPEPPPEQVKYNELLSSLSEEQRYLLAEIIQQSADSAIHDVLVYLTDNEYRIYKNEKPLPIEPFGTSLNYDFVCRREGDGWPDD